MRDGGGLRGGKAHGPACSSSFNPSSVFTSGEIDIVDEDEDGVEGVGIADSGPNCGGMPSFRENKKGL